MTCPRCENENYESDKFCRECRAPLLPNHCTRDDCIFGVGKKALDDHDRGCGECGAQSTYSKAGFINH